MRNNPWRDAYRSELASRPILLLKRRIAASAPGTLEVSRRRSRAAFMRTMASAAEVSSRFDPPRRRWNHEGTSDQRESGDC
jgi:hypothetical protein